MPWMSAPSEPRKRQRSCTCGSQAALPIVVSPCASAAAMTMFSVAITLASSRKTFAPRTPSARMSYASPASTSTPSFVKPWMCGSSLRRPMTSPPGGATIAAPARTSSGPASRNEARIREQSSRSSSVLRISAAWTRTSFGPIHSTSAPRSSISASIVSTSRMRGTLCSTTGSARHARTRRGSAARRSCCPRRSRGRGGAGRLRSRRTPSLCWRRSFRSWASGLSYPASWRSLASAPGRP